MEDGTQPTAQLPPPQQVQPATSNVYKAKFSDSTKLALLLFLLAGNFVALSVPRLSHNIESTPPFWIFASTGLSVIVLSAILFRYLGRLGLGFNRTALVLTFGYTSVVAVIKLFLAPMALYSANSKAEFSYTDADPNSPGYYIITAFIVLLLYLVVFRLLYGIFLKRFEHGLQIQRNKPPLKSRILKWRYLLLIGAIVLTGGGILLLPLLFITDQAAYLSYVFGAFGIPIIAAVVVAILLAFRGFAAIENQAVATGNPALLAGFYWLGVSMIVMFHVMWVIFMITLVSIWPFKTAYSK